MEQRFLYCHDPDIFGKRVRREPLEEARAPPAAPPSLTELALKCLGGHDLEGDAGVIVGMGLEDSLRRYMTEPRQARLFGSFKSWFEANPHQLAIYREYDRETGLQEGPERMWDHEGVLQQTIWYSRGVRHGPYKAYIDHATVSEGRYYRDHAVGIHKETGHRGRAVTYVMSSPYDTCGQRGGEISRVDAIEIHYPPLDEIRAAIDAGTVDDRPWPVRRVFYSGTGAVLAAEYYDVQGADLPNTPPHLKTGVEETHIKFFVRADGSQGPVSFIANFFNGTLHGLQETFSKDGTTLGQHLYWRGERLEYIGTEPQPRTRGFPYIVPPARPEGGTPVHYFRASGGAGMTRNALRPPRLFQPTNPQQPLAQALALPRACVPEVHREPVGVAPSAGAEAPDAPQVPASPNPMAAAALAYFIRAGDVPYVL